MNAALREQLAWLNDRPFKKMAGSRRSLFEDIDRPALRPLPATRYEFATRKKATVNIDYHVEVDRHYYSVPYQLVGQVCDIRSTASTVEMIWRGRRVASHVRRYQPYRHSTQTEHMPDAHRRHLEWSPSRIVGWAKSSGPATASLVEGILESRPHPEQGYRSCLGVLRLGKRFGGERLEAACQRALAVQALSYRSVESILRNGLDKQSPADTAATTRRSPPRERARFHLLQPTRRSAMLVTPTLDKLHTLNLMGMGARFQ